MFVGFSISKPLFSFFPLDVRNSIRDIPFDIHTPRPQEVGFLWGASKVTVEGVVSALLISGLFLRGTEKKSLFLKG